jgi:hypothetical protein
MAETPIAARCPSTHDVRHSTGERPLSFPDPDFGTDGSYTVHERTVSRWLRLQEVHDRITCSGNASFFIFKQSG